VRVHLCACVRVHVCACVCTRVRVCVCVWCVKERERERERPSSEVLNSVFGFIQLQGMFLYVSVCVSGRERERERENGLRAACKHVFVYRCLGVHRVTLHHCNTMYSAVTLRNILQHAAPHCGTLQHTAAHCSTLQHTATQCN